VLAERMEPAMSTDIVTERYPQSQKAVAEERP
jgi:hypothetical protein